MVFAQTCGEYKLDYGFLNINFLSQLKIQVEIVTPPQNKSSDVICCSVVMPPVVTL